MGSALKYVSGLLIVIAVMLAVALPEPFVAPAFAQESGNIFQRLFRSNRKKEERVRVKRVIKRAKPVKRRKSRKSRKTVVASPPPVESTKLENARVVLVVGDFLAGGLADGLETAFADSPGVRVLKRNSGSSGIVRDDYYDWRAKLPEFLDGDKPSIVVVMIGANDRQDFRTTSPRLKRRSDAWRKEYEARALELARQTADRNIPLVWVGMPSFRSSTMSSDMVAFNDIYRRVSSTVNGTFVDIWEGFVNESGAYTTSGPDINGQPARLRAGDGINVTRAGYRKIAFYAEKPLRKLLGDATSPDIGVLGPENLPPLKLDPLASPRIDRTRPVAFDDPELDGGERLLGETIEVETDTAATPADRLTIDGLAGPATPGRADDFTWKPAPKDKTDDGKTGATKP